MRIGSRAVKKLLLIGVGSALILTMGGVGPAQADNGPHRSTAAGENATNFSVNAAGLRCASCHRAHTAKAEYLLKQAQPALCYTCHGAGAPGSTTDVLNGNDASLPLTSSGAALRGGGFAKALIGSGSATKNTGLIDPVTGRIATSGQNIPTLALPAATTSSHNAGGTATDAGIAWGNGPISANPGDIGKTITLECGSCHDPHGNGNYRILRPIPVDSGYAVHEIKAAVVASLPGVTPVVTAAAAVMSPVAGIKIPDAGAKVYTTGNYWLSGDTNVLPDATATLTGTPGVALADGYINNIANWCTTCHTRYLAASGSFKTASGDATFMYRHRSDANYKAGAANCITCHVSHGSNAVMTGVSVGLNPGDTPVGGADSRLLRVDNRGTCQMCHNV